MKVSFLGLGMMGTPMALNIARKFPVIVWNRSPSKYTAVVRARVSIGHTPAQVVQKSDVIFSMLFDGAAIQSILDDDFKKALNGKTLINTSSVSVDFSHHLDQFVRKAGGTFVEMPVSGSKVPAEQGRLVGMIAGERSAAESIRAVVEPITAATIYCGPIGSGLKTKYAVNLYLVTMTAGLAESMNLARAQALDLRAFGDVLNACPLASVYSKAKIAKMLDQDWSAQAAIKDCYNSTELIRTAAETVGLKLPLANVAGLLYKKATESGLGEEDMIAVVKLS